MCNIWSLSHESASGLRIKLRSHLTIVLPCGIVKIDLSTASTNPHMTWEPKRPYVLSISVMPRSQERTVGLEATFTQFQGYPNTPLVSPTTKAFNVVPQKSAIMECISRNDFHSVRGLFESAQLLLWTSIPAAFLYYQYSLVLSPCHSFELLTSFQYAKPNGCSDVFLMLVQGDAGMQNCDQSSVDQ